MKTGNLSPQFLSELVWRFYSMRRRDARAAQPNGAHLALRGLNLCI